MDGFRKKTGDMIETTLVVFPHSRDGATAAANFGGDFICVTRRTCVQLGDFGVNRSK